MLLAAAPVGVHALGVHLRAERGDRIRGAADAGHPLAALADRVFRGALARRPCPLPHVAGRLGGRQSGPAHRRGRQPVHRRRHRRLWHLLLFDPADLDAVLAGVVRGRAVGPVGELHAAGHRHPCARLPVLDRADLRRGRNPDHAPDRPLPGRALFPAPGRGGRPSASRWRGCANTASRSRSCPASAPSKPRSGNRFGAIIRNYLELVFWRKWLLAFTALYGQISPIIPFIFAAPFYFAGTIQLGTMTQTAGAFARVEGALTFFVNYYNSLANFKSVVDRLTSFASAIERAKALGRAGAGAASLRRRARPRSRSRISTSRCRTAGTSSRPSTSRSRPARACCWPDLQVRANRRMFRSIPASGRSARAASWFPRTPS